MEENSEKKVNENNKKQLTIRIIIGASLTCISLIIGVVCGVKIATKTNNISTDNQFSEITNILEKNWLSDIYYGQDVDEKILINQFVGALSTSDTKFLDPYTYLIKKEPATVDKTGKLGITIGSYYNVPVIIEISENSVAKDDLQVGDIIVSAGKNNSEEVSIKDENINYSNLLSSVMGLPNEKIWLKVARFNTQKKIEYLDFSFSLGKNKETPYSYTEPENIDDTIMVKLTGFTSGKTAEQLDKILKNDHSNNLIIDIRDNGGGDLASVVDVCDLFLKANELVTTLEYKDSDEKVKQEYYTTNNAKYDYDKIIILQNGNTASASEILISTLCYYLKDKVTLVGSKSYGKGIAQRTTSVLNNKYTLQYTCARWLRPDNSWIGMHGSFYEDGYQLGFEPLKQNTLEKNNLLNLMEANNTNINWKDNSFAYKEDYVASQNKYIFEIYNEKYNTNIRTDGYFDENCKQAIKQIQEENNLESTGILDFDTYLYFVKDFYDAKMSFSNEHLKIAENIILGNN